MRPGSSMFEPALLRRAVIDAVIKLNPLHMLRNPVMFLVEAGAVITAGAFAIDPTGTSSSSYLPRK
jgi:potassium-transporting ATPase ATP-binding subunit